jgi:Flp pilus assembly protein TadD
MTRERAPGLLVPLAIFAITAVTFVPTLQGEFLNWDDYILFTKNLEFRGLGWPHLRWMFTNTLAGHYIPLTWLTLGLNYSLGGMNPWGFHFAAIMLHATNATLFYLVARRLLAAALDPDGTQPAADGLPVEVSGGAMLAALVFAIHPQRVESVAWITDRGTLLSGALYLVSVLGYLRAVAPTGAIRWRWWGVLSVVTFAGALLAKGMAMSLPVTLLILDAYPLRRAHDRWWRVVREKTPYIVVAVLGAAVILFARNRGSQLSPLSELGVGARLSFAVYSFWFYPASTVLPIGLSPLHEVPASPGLLQWRFLGPLLGLVIVTGALVLLRRRLPGALAAWVHSAAVVAPVSGIAHSGSQLVSDRYSYLAGLGWALVAGYGVVYAARLRRQGRLSGWVSAVGAVGAVLLVVTLAFSTWGQSGTWRDSETLWRWATEQDPECATCEALLGEAIVYGASGGQARLDEAEAHVRRAIALRPMLPLPHYTLGSMRLARGQSADAERSLKIYIQLAPGMGQGPARLALIYLVEGRTGDAVPLLRRARQLDGRPPEDPGGAAPITGNAETEDPSFVEAIRLMGDRWEDLEYLGQALIQQGRAGQAVLPLERASAVAPTASGPRFWLAQAYEAIGQPDRAREQLAVLHRLDPRAPGELSVR